MRLLRSYADALVDDGPIRLPDGLRLHQPNAPWRWWSRRLVAAVASVATVLGGNLGLAVAADGSVPGDLLYPLDRGYERVVELVGIEVDHTAERLAEAATMLDRGRPAAALHLVAEAFDDLDAVPDLDAVGDSVDDIADEEPEPTAAVRDAVTDLISGTRRVRDLARAGENPSDAAQQISDLARAVADAAGHQGTPGQLPGPAGQGPFGIPGAPGDAEGVAPPDGRSEVRPDNGKPPSTPAGPPTTTTP